MSRPGYATVTCGAKGCDAEWKVKDSWLTARKRDHASWYCPNGHRRAFKGESDHERKVRLLTEDRDRIQRGYDYMRGSRDSWQTMAEHEQRRRTGYQGALAKEKRLRLLA